MNIVKAPCVPCAQSENVLNNHDENDNKKMVISKEPGGHYSIVFEGSNFTAGKGIITVKNRREVELLLLILGEEVNVIEDEVLCDKFPEVWEWLSGRTHTEVLAELKWIYREAEAEEVATIVEKIPLPHDLEAHPVKTLNEDPQTNRLYQAYVHKVNNENVLVSKPYQCGNMFFFKGFTKSAEFNIDHISDHLEGIIIFEAARQAGIAAIHLSEVPFSSRIVLLKTIITYKKFVEISEPYIIQTIPVLRPRGGAIHVTFSIVQNGDICASGYMSGLQYRTNESYQKHRFSKNTNATSEQAVGM